MRTLMMDDNVQMKELLVERARASDIGAASSSNAVEVFGLQKVFRGTHRRALGDSRS